MAAVAGCGKVDRPNVVIIYGDDVGYGDLSCYGSTTISTPNVERVADNGIRFTNAHATSAVSTPSRFGLLTGIYPWRVPGTGIAPGDAAMIITPDYYTLPDMMKENGYATAAVGKWHLGLGSERGKQDWNGHISPALNDIGFDYSFIMAATGDRVPCVYIENGEVVNLDPEDPIEVSYSTPFEGEPTGRDNPELLTKLKPSHGHDMAVVNGVSRIGYMKGGKSALWIDEYIGETITGKAIEFMKANKDRPFFLYFGTNDIHVPRVPHPQFVGKSGMGARGDAILSFDWSVGQMTEALEKLGIADNTIVIISSDNGPVVDDGYADRAEELLGDHKPWGDMHDRGGKYSCYEGGTRTPMIVSWGKNVRIPRRNKGKTLATPLSHIDLFASLGQMVGAKIPADAAKDSRPMWKSFTGIDLNGAGYIIEQNQGSALSILIDGWKYIMPSNGQAYSRYTNTNLGNSPEPQLYYLPNDLAEEKNLAEERPKKVEDLKTRLEQITGCEGYPTFK
ncbi:MAG: sulfatase-like hydrolase/transferase [Bacteroidales bacterium]|nr:sulfatase-like hydrolase/transferase [Bacteroidales bacterium]